MRRQNQLCRSSVGVLAPDVVHQVALTPPAHSRGEVGVGLPRKLTRVETIINASPVHFLDPTGEDGPVGISIQVSALLLLKFVIGAS